MTFRNKLDAIVKKNNSLVCVGLDPELNKLPEAVRKQKHPVFEFNKAIIDATSDLVCVYKPNIAFYEAMGIDGLKELKLTLEYLHKVHPDIPVILDAKRGDIGNTSKMYAKSIFEYWNVDAVTVYPHLGFDALEPFFAYKDKLVILLIHTSNPDAKMFQDLKAGKEPYYIALSKKIATWKEANIGIFMGATYPQEMRKVRSIFPKLIFLSAGIGAQKAEVEAIVRAGLDKSKAGIMFNSSRNILYATAGSDFAEAARVAALKLRETINSYRI